MGQWIKDYGGFVAAVLVVAVGLINVFITARIARHGKRLEWAREARMPVYMEFARSIAELGNAAMMDWEARTGVEHWAPLDGSLEERYRETSPRLADVLLVGPEAVGDRARQLSSAAYRYWQGNTREMGATTEEAETYSDAFVAYREAARVALALPS